MIIATLPFYINDNATPTMGIIESDIRKVLAKTPDNKAVIFIDYLQQLPPVGRDGDSASELGRRMQMLDNIAKKFQLPMFVGCQINRANAQTNEKRPDLNSIRGSGEICEKSAVVLGLHRPGYYTRDYTDNSFEVIVLKNRWGRMDETAYFRCDLGISKFEDTSV
jgi:replicative DNA helicase